MYGDKLDDERMFTGSKTSIPASVLAYIIETLKGQSGCRDNFIGLSS